MKMGRRPRCSSVTYRFRYVPLLAASPARTALPTAHFDRNEKHAISGTGHWVTVLCSSGRKPDFVLSFTGYQHEIIVDCIERDRAPVFFRIIG